jgi:hypothetical protein
MSQEIEESDTVVHVFARPSEEELAAAIAEYLVEHNPEDAWTSARVHIVGEAYAQINEDGKSVHEVVLSLTGRGMPGDDAASLVNCAADMQRRLAERERPTAARFDRIRWPEMIFWLVVVVITVKSCAA